MAADYQLTSNQDLVIRAADRAFIPNGHRWWSEYQTWLAAGNTPDPADPPPVPLDLSDINNLDKVLKALGIGLGALMGKTPAQVRTAIQQAYQALS